MNNNEELVNLVRAAVESALTVREGEDRTASIEASLVDANTLVTELTDAISSAENKLTASTEENTDLKAQLSELLAKADELSTKLEQSEQEAQELETRAKASETQLLEIAQVSILKQRMCLLEEAKVAMSGDRLETQMDVVKLQSDEEFASYMEDRVELRASIEESFKVKADEETKEVDEGEITVAPANVEDALIENAAVLPVVEEQAQETIEDKFSRLGKTMAANIQIGRK